MTTQTSARRTTPASRREGVTVQSLAGPWELTWEGGPSDTPAAVRGRAMEAAVPGQVHTALLAAGMIADPDIGMREHAQTWVGGSRWVYRRTVVHPVAPDTDAADALERTGRVDLVADGLDTFARVILNGVIVGESRDQHVGHRWDVSSVLRPGENILEVHFDSAWDVAQDRERATGALPTPYPAPYPQVRKEASNFGWDWGPRYLTAGIWQDIRLEQWTDRLAAVLPQVSLADDHDTASVTVAVDVRQLGRPDRIDPAHSSAGADAVARRVVATLSDPDGRAVARQEVGSPATGSLDLTLEVRRPLLWWPVGLGDQPLYDLVVELRAGDAVLDTSASRIGIRSVDLDETPDGRGSRWGLVVNGRAVRVRGYNWIPDDPIASRVTASAIEARLDDAVEGGANLLRVWGGGHFAEEALLSGCDERGLLVWHDFLFACAAYDESDEMLALVEEEARQAVTRMAPHPSLVVWCGGNECVWGWWDWHWKDIVGDRPWGRRIYTELLPAVLAELDPTRVYVPNSPWSAPDAHPNDEGRGPTHLWEQWNDRDYATYRHHDPAFVSEMGWCAPPARSTLRRAVEHGELGPENPQVVHHMRAADGMAKLTRGLQAHLPVPATPDAWLFATQLVQARAESVGTEWLRSRERCAGVVIWQLNDCWPSLSWAAVDVDGVRKPLWYALRDSFTPRLLTIQPLAPGDTQDPTGPDGLELVAVNDGAEPWTTDVRVRRLDLSGTVLVDEVRPVAVEPGGIQRFPLGALARASDPAGEVLVADHAGGRAAWWYRPDRRSGLASWHPTVTVERGEDHLDVRVTSDVVARDVTLLVDQVADTLGVDPARAGVDRMMVTMVPGEELRLRLTGLGPAAGHELEPTVGDAVRAALWSANDVVGERH